MKKTFAFRRQEIVEGIGDVNAVLEVYPSLRRFEQVCTVTNTYYLYHSSHTNQRHCHAWWLYYIDMEY